ncbi:MAG: Methyltransferase type 11 [Parcubacteria group bacterium GW2011_GWA2_39_18]|nr:MAG: Methyltransferase type 11 [Parcubacteria group bacterium GW2011_GWA2_39_18]
MVGFINPLKLLPLFELSEGMQVADFGSGTGYFAILTAKKIGPSGRVMAIDVQEPALEAVRSRARLENLFNLQVIRANLEIPQSTRLSDNSQDRIYIHNVLFQSEKKENVLQEAFRVLKSGGKIIFIDWLPEKYPSDRSLVRLLSKIEAKNLLEKMGFKMEKDFVAGAYHYGLIANKP